MENRNDIINEDEIKDIELIQKVEKLLCKKLNIPSLKSGNITIRNEQNFRINEKEIDYFWLVNIAKSFVGWCWLFTLKFNDSNFRNTKNPETITQGIFTIDKNQNINEIFLINRNLNFIDKIKEIKTYDLFNANSNITLDGVSYKFIINTINTTVRFQLYNPNSESWKKWAKLVDELGKELSEKSNLKEFKEIFF